jgi:hypothetical protein
MRGKSKANQGVTSACAAGLRFGTPKIGGMRE